jgi:hypothetical protein
MSNGTQEIRCPACGGGQPPQDSEHYECRFCLTPFTYRVAIQESERLFEEIRTWVEQKVGGGTGTGEGTGIDASSRAYLFRKNLLPSLRMAQDRAKEVTLGFQRFPLLPSIDSGAAVDGNPLLKRRTEIQQLKDLRARLASPDVGTFVVTDEDRRAIRTMDLELREIQGLSNVAMAGAERTARGFAAARNNLESLLEETDPHALVAERLRALADLAGLLERAFESSSLVGESMAPDAERIGEALRDVARRFETEQGLGAERSLISVAARREADHADALARWLRSYDAVVRRVGLGFGTFLEDTLAILGQEGSGGRDGARAIESYAAIQKAMRGEIPVLAHERFEWVAPLGRRERKGKLFAAIGLGFLGLTEEVGNTEHFFIPFWLVQASGSRWLVDACGSGGEQAHRFDDGWSDLVRRLDTPVALQRPLDVPVPTVSAARAAEIVATALRLEGRVNPEIDRPQLALLPATRIEYVKKGRPERHRLSCLDDRLPVEPTVIERLSVGRRLKERFQ